MTWEPIYKNIANIVGIDSLGSLYIRSDSTVTEYTGPIATGHVTYTRLLRSSDYGSSWENVYNSPLYSTNRQTVVFGIKSAIDGTVVITTSIRQGEVPRRAMLVDVSSDGGKSFVRLEEWEDRDENYRPLDVEVLNNGKVLVVGEWYNDLDSLQSVAYYRYDPISKRTSSLNCPDVRDFSVGPTGTVYGWHSRNLYWSSDYGETWKQMLTPANGTHTVRDFIEKANNILFLLSIAPFVSTDSGKTWSQIDRTPDWSLRHGGTFNAYIPAIVLSDGTIYDYIHVDHYDEYRGDTSFYHYFTFGRSGDGGRTWDYPIGDKLSLKYVSLMALSSDGTLLVGTKEDGLYRITAKSLSVPEEHGGRFRLQQVELDLH